MSQVDFEITCYDWLVDGAVKFAFVSKSVKVTQMSVKIPTTA